MMKKILVIILIVIVALSMIVPTMMIFGDEVNKKGDEKQLSLVFTHDIHSHLENFPKLGTIIEEHKKTDPDAFVVDAGDFAMGTPYQTIFKAEAAELRMLGFLGFDATTLGNHEFDFRSSGLSAMLNRAVEAKKTSDKEDLKKFIPARVNLKLPQMVISNIDWDKTLADSDLKEDGEILKAAMENYGVKDYTVIEKNKKKIAFFGIFGKLSAEYSPESGTIFKDPIASAKEVVAKIKSEENPDLIVCLSHSGTNPEDKANSEDEILAEKVDGIDLIVSGHTHSLYFEPLKVKNTLIVSSGEFAEHAGIVKFKKDDNGKFAFENYEIKDVSAAAENPKVAAEIKRFKNLVDEEFFGEEGWKWDQVIARSNSDFTETAQFGKEQGDDALGNLLSDSFVYGTKLAEADKYESVDFALVPQGIVRGTFKSGDVTVADAYNSLSLGTGKDGEPGYPLVSVYLTGREVRFLAEVDATVSPKMLPARLYMSGLMYNINPKRMFLNRIEEIYKINQDTTDKDHNPLPYAAGAYGSEEVEKAIDSAIESKSIEKLDSSKLYRVVSDLYSCQMLGAVGEKSKGLLSIVPKDKAGNEIKNFEDHIIYRDNGKELKEWYAVTSYIDSFDGDIFPARYSSPEARKVVNPNGSIRAFLRNPNKIAWMAIGIVVLAVAVLILIIVLIVKLIQRLIFGRKLRNAPVNIFGPGGGGIYRGYASKKGSIFRGKKNRYKNRF